MIPLSLISNLFLFKVPDRLMINFMWNRFVFLVDLLDIFIRTRHLLFFFFFGIMLADHFEWEACFAHLFLFCFLSLAVPFCFSLMFNWLSLCIQSRGYMSEREIGATISRPVVPFADFVKGTPHLEFLPSSFRLWGICKAVWLCFFPSCFPNVHDCSVNVL